MSRPIYQELRTDLVNGLTHSPGPIAFAHVYHWKLSPLVLTILCFSLYIHTFLLYLITSQLYCQFYISTIPNCLITSNLMLRPRKPVKFTSQSEVHKLHNSFPTTQPRTCLPTICFYDSIKSSFRKWLKGQKNQELFDNRKRIRY